jgi:hypothetical protein
MTEEQLSLLKSSIDQVVEIETAADGPHLAQILFVFDEGETPDVFYVKVAAGSDGEFVPEGKSGCSVLLSEVLAVRPHRG